MKKLTLWKVEIKWPGDVWRLFVFNGSPVLYIERSTAIKRTKRENVLSEFSPLFRVKKAVLT